MPKLSRKERLEMLIEMDEALSQHRLFKSTFMKRYNLTEQNVGAYLRLLEEIGQAIDDERVRIFIEGVPEWGSKYKPGVQPLFTRNTRQAIAKRIKKERIEKAATEERQPDLFQGDDHAESGPSDRSETKPRRSR